MRDEADHRKHDDTAAEIEKGATIQLRHVRTGDEAQVDNAAPVIFRGKGEA
jgi:hypothetical protein